MFLSLPHYFQNFIVNFVPTGTYDPLLLQTLMVSWGGLYDAQSSDRIYILGDPKLLVHHYTLESLRAYSESLHAS